MDHKHDNTITIAPIFDGCVVYGPYYNKRIGRYIVNIDKGGVRTTYSYARFVYMNATNAAIPDDLEVDHKDNNKLNDSFDNLQLLPRLANYKKSLPLRSVELAEIECPVCKRRIIRPKNETHLYVGSVPRKRMYTTCSRSCQMRGVYMFPGDYTYPTNIIRIFKTPNTTNS